MHIEKRLQDILLYALGMVGSNPEKITSGEFYQRIAKYLRSIGYYGDSPFMMCNYGSSEYAQAFSRIGSLFGNVYIVTEDFDLQEMTVEDGKITEVEINYNNEPIKLKEGIVAGFQFRNQLADKIGMTIETPTSTSQCLRVTII